MDTVAFRLHNLENYPVTLLAVQKLKGKGFALIEDSPDLVGVTSFRKAVFNRTSDSFRMMSYTCKAWLPSSASGVNIRYDDSNRYIHFECSLPKFFFGNNVIELIPPPQSKRYVAGSLNMYDLCTQFWLKAMKYAFKRIIFELTNGKEKVKYWGDVQLFRWDICFNQIFNTKDDALTYRDSQKQVSAKRISDANKVVYDNGNITYKTENYYFKVYHKGTDFAVNGGSAQIRKAFTELGGKLVHKTEYRKNNLLGEVPIKTTSIVVGNKLKEDSNLVLSLQNIEQLQAYADRILRYELECTSKLMSYLYNTKLAKRKILGYEQLNKRITYISRAENLELYQRLQIRYRGTDGKLYNSYEKLDLFTTEYYLPDIKSDKKHFETYLIDNPQTLKRVKKILLARSYIKKKFGISKPEEIKAIDKFLQSEKSKEHKFFLDTPLQISEDGQTYEPVVNAQQAISPNEIPQGVYYDGPVMNILEAIPTEQRNSIELMKLCIEKHNALFQGLQFEELPEIKRVEELVKKYNKMIDSLPKIKGKKKPSKMNVSLMKTLFRAFKHDTWDDLRREREVSRKTLYNWKQKVQKLFNSEITQNFISGVDLSNVPRSPYQMYSRHYDEMLWTDSPISLFQQNTSQLMLF